MASNPVVTVLMPVHNGADYLPEAIESILAQTFGDFEFLIVDDGSTDGARQILARYAARDARIKIERNPANMGLAYTLNRGLTLARGAYVARMDGDDVSLPDRLERQVAFMQSHARVGVCGAWVRKIGELGRGVERYPTEDADIRCHLLFRDVLAHPAIVLRRDLFAKHNLAYDPSYERAQDYDLWVRAARHVELANLPRVLLHYRMHLQQAGQRQRDIQSRAAERVRLHQIEYLGIQPTAEQAATHQAISTSRFRPDQAFILVAEAWLRGLRAANRRGGVYPEPAFARAVAARWYMVCRLSTALGPWAWWAFWRSPLSRAAAVNPPRLARFALKCLARSPSL